MSSIRRKTTRRSKAMTGRRRRKATRSTRTTRGRKRASERKSKDVTIPETLVGGTLSSSAGGTGNAYTLLLNGIAAGADYDERIGRKVVIKDMIISMAQLPAISQTGVRLHYAIVRDKNPTGTLPTVDDVYDQYGLRNLDNTPRFHVHQQKTYTHHATSNSGATEVDPRVPRYLKKRVPLNFVESFNDSAATLGAISGEALYLMCWTDAMGAGNVDVTIDGKVRVRFSEE